LGFNGDLYPSAGATSVLSTKGDLVRYDSERERYGIGSAGQVLQVASSLPTWSTINLADSVLTTQGDVLYEGASALARLGQSTDNFTLATKGAGANPAWQASSTSTMSGTGDVLYSSGANTLARLAIGSTDDVLTVAGGVPTWASAGGGGAYEFLGVNSVTSGTTLTTSFTEVQPPDYVIGIFCGEVTNGQGNDIEINADSSALYDQIGSYQVGTSETLLSTLDQVRWNGVLSSIAGVGCICKVEVHTNPERSECYAFIDTYTTDSASGAQKGFSTIRGQLSSAQTGITQIRFFGGSNFTGTLNCWAVRN